MGWPVVVHFFLFHRFLLTHKELDAETRSRPMLDSDSITALLDFRIKPNLITTTDLCCCICLDCRISQPDRIWIWHGFWAWLSISFFLCTTFHTEFVMVFWMTEPPHIVINRNICAYGTTLVRWPSSYRSDTTVQCSRTSEHVLPLIIIIIIYTSWQTHYPHTHASSSLRAISIETQKMEIGRYQRFKSEHSQIT